MSITLESFGEKNLQHIEYFLAQSVKGQHLLFQPEQIRLVYTRPKNGNLDFENEDREQVQNLFARLIECSDLYEKQNYLASLSEEDQELLIKAYFHIVENTIKNALGQSH